MPLWWKVANRNKKGISVDLRTAEGRDIVARLLPGFDVLVDNFRPGTLDGWGMSREWLHEQNPALTILRVTGFGQTGPYRNKPGFARVFEAMSGLTNICGESDGRPLHMGFPIADAVAGLFGALGIVAALYREKVAPRGQGQEIDCSLMESMFRVMDFLPIEYDQLGIVRGRLGNSSQYAAPGNVPDAGRPLGLHRASTQRIFERLCVALELTGVAEDPRYRTNPDRVRNREALDALVADAIARRTLDELAALLDAHAVGFSPIYDIADIFRDLHIAAREGIVSRTTTNWGPSGCRASCRGSLRDAGRRASRRAQPRAAQRGGAGCAGLLRRAAGGHAGARGDLKPVPSPRSRLQPGPGAIRRRQQCVHGQQGGYLRSA